MLRSILLSATVVSGLIFALPVAAQDYGPYGYGGASGGFNWDGFYAGVYGGGVPMGTASWNAGVFAGVNVTIDSAVLGIEAQLGADFANTTSFDALVLGKGGVTLGDAMVYGAGGTGVVSGAFGYALGGGAEYAFTETMSARGEVLGLGTWGAAPSDLRVAVGLAFHL